MSTTDSNENKTGLLDRKETPAIVFTDLGRNASYPETIDLQRVTREKLIAGDAPQTIFFCEHPPTITLGRGANPSHLLLSREELAAKGYGVYETERGGEVTYHGPGQIVCYPILDLTLYKRDIGWYMRTLEQSIIVLLHHFGINAERIPGEAGVWLLGGKKKRKIASVGVHLTRWRTMHGLALNYLPQHEKFSVINPCGFTDIAVTSIEEEATCNKENNNYLSLQKLLKQTLLSS